MNKDIAQGKWEQFKGRVRETWGEISDDELDRVQGQKERLVGLLQEKFGVARDKAEKKIDSLQSEFETS